MAFCRTFYSIFNKFALIISITEILRNSLIAININTTDDNNAGRKSTLLIGETDEWWQLETSPLDQLIFVRSVDLDEGHIHSCYEYKVIAFLSFYDLKAYK